MKKTEMIIIAAIAAILLISGQSMATKITIEVTPVIKGTTFYFNYSDPVNNTPQQFWTYWENRGSIGCTNRLRVDIYNRTIERLGKNGNSIDYINESNQKRLTYTAWSRNETFMPGTNADMFAYFEPFNFTGNFTAQPRVYTCNEIIYLEPFEFEVIDSIRDIASEDIFEKIEIANIDRNHIRISIIPKEDMNSTLVVPEKHITGWIVEHAKFEDMKMGQEYTQEIYYNAGIWMPTNITLGFVTNNGEAYIRKEFMIEDKQDEGCNTQLILAIILLAGIAIAGIHSVNKKHKNKKTKNEPEPADSKKTKANHERKQH